VPLDHGVARGKRKRDEKRERLSTQRNGGSAEDKSPPNIITSRNNNIIKRVRAASEYNSNNKCHRVETQREAFIYV